MGLIPDPYHWGPTYYGDVRTVAACFDGLPVLGNTFHNDAAARQRIVESVRQLNPVSWVLYYSGIP